MTRTARHLFGPIVQQRGRAVLAVVAVAALVAGCAAADEPGGAAAEDPTTSATASWTLPGDDVFPEGIATDPEAGTFYVGSTSDGAIYRGDVAAPGVAERWLEGDTDGRTTVTGLDVDDRGRLWIMGRDSGRAFVHDTATGDRLASFTAPPADRSLLNDVAVTDTAAYLTDSFRPVLFRVPLDGGAIGELEPWLDLGDTPAAYGDGFNLNGIVAADDGTTLLTVKYNSGELFRIDAATGDVTTVDLSGGDLRTGDGMVLDGDTLYVVRGGPGEIVPVTLDDGWRTGRIGDPLATDGLALPTTIAPAGDTLLVVNSQLDMAGGDREPTLPFTVTAIDR